MPTTLPYCDGGGAGGPSSGMKPAGGVGIGRTCSIAGERLQRAGLELRDVAGPRLCGEHRLTARLLAAFSFAISPLIEL